MFYQVQATVSAGNIFSTSHSNGKKSSVAGKLCVYFSVGPEYFGH